jgi:predicted transcriptional regulator
LLACAQISKSKQAMTDTTITVRVTRELRERLEALAKQTKRSKSFLSNEAIKNYVEYEEKVVADILEGLGDIKAGRVVEHDEATRRFSAAIARGTRKSA